MRDEKIAGVGIGQYQELREYNISFKSGVIPFITSHTSLPLSIYLDC